MDMHQDFEEIVRNGRSTAGAKQKNVEHQAWKLPFQLVN